MVVFTQSVAGSRKPTGTSLATDTPLATQELIMFGLDKARRVIADAMAELDVEPYAGFEMSDEEALKIVRAARTPRALWGQDEADQRPSIWD